MISLGKPCHGYGVIQSVREMSHGRVELGPGTLYGAFSRLMKQELIERSDSGPDPEDDRRKLYVLTDLGREVIRGEIARLEEMVRLGLNALETGGKQ